MFKETGYWGIELQGEERAKYGAEIIKKLSKELTAEYGKGYAKTNLYSFYSFYMKFPQIFHSVSGKSEELLSWTYYRTLLQVEDTKAREWYAKESFNQTWSAEIETQKTMFYLQQQESQNKE